MADTSMSTKTLCLITGKGPLEKRTRNYVYQAIFSVYRMVMENRPVDPGSIQGSHRPTYALYG